VKFPCPLLSLSLIFFLLPTGCGRMRPQPKNETVYVLQKQTFLRDRVAAVSNRVAAVQNGQKLELLERGRRFLKVKTEKGEIGWIEEHAVVNPQVVAGFEQLRKAHEHDPAVATASLRDDGYLHLKPGRDTDRYYLLPEGMKLLLLLRASVPKSVGPQASGSQSSFAGVPQPQARRKPPARPPAAGKDEREERKAPAILFHPSPPPPPPASVANPQAESPEAEAPAPEAPAQVPTPMEDWWLVRDSSGKIGWLMSRRFDVDVPDEISGYSAGRRIVAAYLLRKVDDPESNFPDKMAAEYLTVLTPYQDGLPYDFNQIQVFTWNLKRHRYETAFRLRDLQGYLPVVVDRAGEDKTGNSPTFQLTLGVGDAIKIDPDTGAVRPAATETATYVLTGSLVKKVVPASAAPPPRAVPATAPRVSGQKNATSKSRRPSRLRRHRPQ
jgi:hypothetical protein